jgi:hypothetical protein
MGNHPHLNQADTLSFKQKIITAYRSNLRLTLLISANCRAHKLKWWWDCNILHYKGCITAELWCLKSKKTLTELLHCKHITGFNLEKQWSFAVYLKIFWNIWHTSQKLDAFLSWSFQLLCGFSHMEDTTHLTITYIFQIQNISKEHYNKPSLKKF